MTALALLSSRRLVKEAVQATERDEPIVACELLEKAVTLALNYLDRIEGAVKDAIVISAGPQAAENALDTIWQQLLDDPLTRGMRMKKNGDEIEIFLGAEA
jgi:hypothetical protein